MPIAHLDDRGVVRVAGEDAKAFLDGLLTCDLDRVSPGWPRYGALLTPQGKILCDLILFADADGGYVLDCPGAQATDLARRLGFYKLRAKVVVADQSSTLAVVAGWGDSPKPDSDNGLVAVDPRLPALGWRAVTKNDFDESFISTLGAASDAYHAHRVGLGVPEGGKDFLFGEAFPHEALMDQLHGVDFDKGCYVGQEVVSRMQHRGTARTRIVPLVYPGGLAAEAGAEVSAGERIIGRTGSGVDRRGLAMIRLDRAADALAAGEAILAGGRPVRLDKSDWVTFPVPSEAATPAA